MDGVSPRRPSASHGPQKPRFGKGLRMLYVNKTRFKKTEDALRFYFRLRELLHSGRARRLMADELPAVACPSASNAIDDYQGIGWGMHGLAQTDFCPLSPLYHPTS